ncbi:hypothetical protein F4677DRAFT_440718 [Hypoxylon crocopeplum]|nr:hypothetical protein F4677DRAFT_440718 [Hypoxylon crocopeplum]
MAQVRFSELPVELRLQIWEEALHRERLVLVSDRSRTVCPMRKLVSPLLAVNRESRRVAKAFYNLTLDVHRISDQQKLDQPSHVTSQDPVQGPSAGILYLSLDWDIFTSGIEWKIQQWKGSSLGIMDNCETKSINTADYYRIATLRTVFEPIQKDPDEDILGEDKKAIGLEAQDGEDEEFLTEVGHDEEDVFGLSPRSLPSST